MYSYENQRLFIFTDEGQRMFLKIRDKTFSILKTSGAITLEKAISGQTGDSWNMIACVDRMVELGELVEISNHVHKASNYRIFMRSEP